MEGNQTEKLLDKLQLIENLLREKQTDLLNLNEAAQYLSISHSHLYKLTSKRKIPFHKPSGKYLYFFKHELNTWIRQNDVKEAGNGRPETEAGVDNEPGLFDEEKEKV